MELTKINVLTLINNAVFYRFELLELKLPQNLQDRYFDECWPIIKHRFVFQMSFDEARLAVNIDEEYAKIIIDWFYRSYSEVNSPRGIDLEPIIKVLEDDYDYIEWYLENKELEY